MLLRGLGGALLEALDLSSHGRRVRRLRRELEISAHLGGCAGIIVAVRLNHAQQVRDLRDLVVRVQLLRPQRTLLRDVHVMQIVVRDGIHEKDFGEGERIQPYGFIAGTGQFLPVLSLKLHHRNLNVRRNELGIGLNRCVERLAGCLGLPLCGLDPAELEPRLRIFGIGLDSLLQAGLRLVELFLFLQIETFLIGLLRVLGRR